MCDFGIVVFVVSRLKGVKKRVCSEVSKVTDFNISSDILEIG